jgi:mannose-1-phosphate guanylyltransferase/phosphomannomutase
MKAVIMAGGFGTRLRPLTWNIPKPLVPMMNRPIMEHIIRLLRSHGITDIVVTLFYHPDLITNYFGDGSQLGVQLKYVRAEVDYGTAGSVRNAASLLGERFVVISGDVLTDFNLTQAIDFHERRDAEVTIVLYHSQKPLEYGVVITRDNGRIVRFVEKPTWGEVISDTINTGIYVIEPGVLGLVPKEQEFDFSKDLFPILLEKDAALMGYALDGYWRDIGNLREYQEAHWDCLASRVKVELPGEKKGTVYRGHDSRIQTDIENLTGTVLIGVHSVIGENAKISNSVIGDSVTVEAGASVEDAILWSDTVIRRGAKLKADVVASGTVIGEEAEVSENVFIGERCSIGARARLMGNIKLWPAKNVEDGAILTKSLVWEDRWQRELFTDARITGHSNIEMNPEFGARLGAAFGAFVGPGKTIVTSRDGDNVSRMMSRAFMCGVISAGVQVNDLRATPIPILRHELGTGGEAGGVHARKSPYDSRKTDLIFFDKDGKDLPVSKTKAIERLFFGEEVPRVAPEKVGTINFPERTTESYRQKFQSSLNVDAISKRRFRIVIDYSYGISATIFPTLIGSLDCEVIALNAYVDSNRLAGELQEVGSAIHQLSHIVTSLGFDLGCKINAGGEKLVVVDEMGNVLDSDRLLVLVTKLFLGAKPSTKKIAVPISASMEVDLVAKEHGVEIIKTKDSHLGMMSAATIEGVGFVGGTRGGFIFPEFGFAADAMFGVAKILELSAVTGEKLGALDKKLPRLSMLKRDIPCPWEMKGKIMRYFMQESEGQRRDFVDGIKIYPADSQAISSILVMPDKERALFHLRVEASDESSALRLANRYEQKILEWKNGTGAPDMAPWPTEVSRIARRGAKRKK